MFSNLGWSEIAFLFIIGLIVIGPERLPRVIEDVRAGLIAARRAIDNVKQELNDEMGPEFQQLSQPLSELAKLRAMGPKAALTKTLLDGDGSLLESFDPHKIMSTDTAGEQARKNHHTTPQAPRVPRSYDLPAAEKTARSVDNDHSDQTQESSPYGPTSIPGLADPGYHTSTNPRTGHVEVKRPHTLDASDNPPHDSTPGHGDYFDDVI